MIKKRPLKLVRWKCVSRFIVSSTVKVINLFFSARHQQHKSHKINTLIFVGIFQGSELTQKDDSSQELFAKELLDLFSGELNPVAPKAQKKVPVPEG